jgi:hypothetical protein
MRDPFAGYDAWLERPYQDMMDESDKYYAWCEENDLDPDDEDAVLAYSRWCDDTYEYELEFDYEEDDDYDF